MNFAELFILAVGLSMDAFAVAVCKGLSMKKITFRKAALVGFYFGFFQAAMPAIGYLLGVNFQKQISSIDHWIAFLLLGAIGVNMILEARKGDGCDECGCDTADADLSFRTMLILALATSIDALAVGITFAFLKVRIVPAISFIGVITFLLSMLGVRIGNVFGSRYKAKAEFMGGIILICLGAKILLEHLGILTL
ncbi:manganese efflux pump MntP family protein [Diplocloster agilis]|uniref:Putative manganese efflux pump MntP n=1 Tax=Diplocloster agilis TaxID=2850323 RepID=A0A949JWK3_9FIRM|nr:MULTISPECIES: manganese efflux pump MntP family protein [Lachnospiraceae]MBU9735959.1 manganese efflux pump MntP family protein [Diplocloster agilis]MBU9745420.1 manganese efflux pump MntP family protein [Diplocloster agilis]MCU6732868.1 manganese efflux pump MntP family protein [Suonthocola fibrivorans]SCI65615.1 putative sporulation protein YtaF [uncultured Clostridium sp.]